MQYLRAFFEAMRLTLRGETIVSPAEREFPALFGWIKAGQKHLSVIDDQLEQHPTEAANWQQIKIHVDGRDMTLKTVLDGVRYHLTQEYPYLLENFTDHSLTALYASNLNDQYWVQSLAQLDNLPTTLNQPLTNLSAHLRAIPPSTDVRNSPT